MANMDDKHTNATFDRIVARYKKTKACRKQYQSYYNNEIEEAFKELPHTEVKHRRTGDDYDK